MYGQVDLHPSQQISDPPVIKRNLVRNIVAQFNEEAKKRNKHASNDDYYNSRNPLIIDSDDEIPSNNNNNTVPFSYTSTLPFMYQKSKSEYDLKSPNEVIYAQVVVNGQGTNGKTTVHTKVPVKGATKKYATMSNGIHKNHSMSMGNLQSTQQQQHQQQQQNSSAYSKINVSAHDVNHVYKHPVTSRKYAVEEYKHMEGSRSESPYATDLNVDASKRKRNQKINNVAVATQSAKKTREESSRRETRTTKDAHQKSTKEKERIRSRSQDTRMPTSRIIPKEPQPDYNNHSDGWDKIEYRDVYSEYKKEVKEVPNSDKKTRRSKVVENLEYLEPTPDYDDKVQRGIDEVDRSVSHSNNVVQVGTANKEGQLLSQNGVRKEIIKGNVTNQRTTELITQEKTVTRTHRSRSSSSNNKKEKSEREEMSAEKMKQEKEKKSKIKREVEDSTANQVKREQEANDRRFYYFGANEEIIRPTRKKEKEKVVKAENAASGLSSTKLVKEANAQVGGQEKYAAHSKWKSGVDLTHVSESPTGSANQDSGYFSRGGVSPISKEKAEVLDPVKERIINVEVEGRKGHRHQTSLQRKEESVTNSFFHDAEERFETSESDDIPNHWKAGGSHGSQASAPSNQWSSLEEDEEEIVAAHVNTPQSLIREMGKREISYENSQRPLEKDAEVLWTDKSQIDSDYRKEMSTGCFNGGTEGLQNDDHVNNNWGTSATLSRLETNKNRINNDTTLRSSTVDRRDWKANEKNGNSNAVRILLNGRDVTDSEQTSARHHTTGILSKTSNYASETESQHSGRSKGSKKSSSSSPALKRVNFKTRSKAKRSVSSAANLSPIHREAMLRAGSPVRPPSAAESLHSSGSEASHGSVILHAPTVADIPPPTSYRYRIYKESSISGSPIPTRKSGKAVTRSFSLLSPWKPKKYKQKHEQKSDVHSDGSMKTSTPEKSRDEASRHNSSEKLDSLSPLPMKEENHKSKKVVRTNSVPKDTIFGGLFRRKKEKA